MIMFSKVILIMIIDFQCSSRKQTTSNNISISHWKTHLLFLHGNGGCSHCSHRTKLGFSGVHTAKIRKAWIHRKPYRERRCGKTSYSLCILAGYHRYFFLSHLPCFQSASFVLLPTLAGHLRPILGFSGQFSLVAKRMNQVEEPSPNAKKIKSYIIYNLNIYLYIYIISMFKNYIGSHDSISGPVCSHRDPSQLISVTVCAGPWCAAFKCV
jgi:hypothetical protein